MKALPIVGVVACASAPEQPVEVVPDRRVGSIATPTDPLPATGSLWNQEPASLFGNRRARNIGDVLTVIVEINEEAEIGNEVDRIRNTSEVFAVRSLFGLPDAADTVLPEGANLAPAVDFERDRSFQGRGNIRREDRITLRLAARVESTLPNGDLVIEGIQKVRVNHEERILRASGIVRPEDISRSNTITHDKIAEAHIDYVGKGEISRTVKPRIGNRALDWIIPF